MGRMGCHNSALSVLVCILPRNVCDMFTLTFHRTEYTIPEKFRVPVYKGSLGYQSVRLRKRESSGRDSL